MSRKVYEQREINLHAGLLGFVITCIYVSAPNCGGRALIVLCCEPVGGFPGSRHIQAYFKYTGSSNSKSCVDGGVGIYKFDDQAKNRKEQNESSIGEI